MPPNELLTEAARHVPGSGAVGIRPLGNGLVNETYRVLRDGAAYALRLAAPNPHALGPDRAWEAQVLERAGAAGVAPALEYCDAARGILILRWVEGRTWTAPQARRPANIARMAQLLRRIHSLRPPLPARVMSPMDWILHYSAAASSRNAALRGAATARAAALEGLGGADRVLCHSDLHTLNLIDRGGPLMLLDWEYAHVSEPLWDLAGWSANNDFEDEPRQALLAAYLNRPASRDERRRLSLLEWLYDYVCLLWSELYLDQYADAHQGDSAPSNAPQAGSAPGPAPQGDSAPGRAPQGDSAPSHAPQGGSGRDHAAADPAGPEGVAARARLLAARLEATLK
ncbi:MAG TPA: phosphotransferase [Steroidobacteraceae bacterium]|nr:phosphotransferase [Steroidobacteraceae bacterium]